MNQLGPGARAPSSRWGGHAWVRVATLVLTSLVLDALRPASALAQAEAVAREPRPVPTAEGRKPIDEITVTGRRRTERLLDVPSSVQVFGAEELASAGVQDVKDVFRLASNAYVEERSGGDAVISVRGLNTGDMNVDPSVGLYVDGAYTFFRGVQDSPRLFDLESVEILRGPQGGIYGRNSVGGAVLINTARPTWDFLTQGEAKLGSDRLRSYSGVVNLPLLDERLAARVAYSEEQQDNFISNEVLGRRERDPESRAGRLKLLFTPSESLEVLLGFERARDTNSGLDRLAPGSPPDRRRTVADFLGITRQDTWRYNLDVGWDAGGDLTVRYLGSYRDMDRTREFDQDGQANGTPTVFDQDFDSDQQTHELRLSGAAASGLEWTLAGIYYRDTSRVIGGTTSPGVQQPATIDGEYTSRAVFTDVSYPITDTVKLAGHLGYTIEKLDFTNSGQIILGPDSLDLPTLSQAETERVLTPGVDLSWLVTPDVLLYASYATSYKSGGFNTLLNVDLQDVQPTTDLYYQPEKVYGFEVGAKTTWFDGRLIANVSLFDMQQRALQTRLPIGNDSLTQRPLRPFVNVGEADRVGVEVELIARPSEGLQLSFGYGLTDTELKHARTQAGIASGNELMDVPRYTFNAGLDYTRELWDGVSGYLRVDYQSRLGGKRDLANVVDLDDQALANLRFGVELANGMSVGFFAKNLLNRAFYEIEPDVCIPNTDDPNLLNLPADQACTVVFDRFGAVPNRPRVVGIEVRYQYP